MTEPLHEHIFLLFHFMSFLFTCPHHHHHHIKLSDLVQFFFVISSFVLFYFLVPKCRHHHRKYSIDKSEANAWPGEGLHREKERNTNIVSSDHDCTPEKIDLLWIGSLRIYFSEIWFKIQCFYLLISRKCVSICLKISTMLSHHLCSNVTRTTSV